MPALACVARGAMNRFVDLTQTKFSPTRNPLTYSKVKHVLGPIMRAWPIRKRPQQGAYLNIGAGPHANPGFFNVDYDYHSGIDLYWDLRRRLPISDATIGGIFSEHCLEHLGYDIAQQALCDFHRVMMPGATIRISVPDGGLYARRFAAGEALPFQAEETARDLNWTAMQSLNMVFYGHGHRFIYDFTTMARCLSSAGFVDVRQEEIGQGRDPRLLIDQPARARESLYVEASKAF